MKVKVNIINMRARCFPMAEAVTVPRLTMLTSTVSEESLARNAHTETQKTRYQFYVDIFFALQTKRSKTNRKKTLLFIPRVLQVARVESYIGGQHTMQFEVRRQRRIARQVFSTSPGKSGYRKCQTEI